MDEDRNAVLVESEETGVQATMGNHAEQVRPFLLGMSWFPDVPGGLNRYLADLHAALSENHAGAPPQTLVLGPCAAPPPGVTAVSDHHRPLLIRWAHLVRKAGVLGREADLIDAHFALHALPVIVFAFRRRPIVVHFQGPWAAESSSARGDSMAVAVKRWVERRVYRRADAAVTLSYAFKRIFVESYGGSPWTVQVISPAVNLGRFTPGGMEEARRQLGVPLDAKVVSTVRRLLPRMGIATLLRAWQAISKATGERALLLVAGQGPEEQSLRQLATDLGIGDTVRFLGRLPDEDVVRLYRASDAVVVPSVELEGFGLVVIEALACGTPVIATDVGGLPEALLGLGCHTVVPAGNHAALAQRVTGALDGADPLPSAAACRAHAERFSPAKVAAEHRQLYQRTVRPASSRKPRVVYLDHCAQPSGGELALLRLLGALEAVDTHVLLAEDGPLVHLLESERISVEVLAMRPTARDLRKDAVNLGQLPLTSATGAAIYCLRIARRLKQLKPDFVHTNSLKSAVYGGLAARSVGLPVVWHLRDRIDATYLPPSAIRLINGLSRVIPNAVVANSTSTLSTLPHFRGPTAVVASPVHRDAFASPPERTFATSDDIRIVMVGRIAPWKGQDLFIKAFRQAFPSDGATATIVGAPLFGEKSYLRDLHELVGQLGLNNRVDLVGHLPNVAEMLRHNDVAVNASISPEPFGLVVVEAMAAGLPVVAANAGGPAEVIRHGVDGLLFEPGSVSSLAAALEQIASDPELRHRLAQAARARAAEFSPEHISDAMLAFYRNAFPRLSI